jgi:hypothetical protein
MHVSTGRYEPLASVAAAADVRNKCSAALQQLLIPSVSEIELLFSAYVDLEVKAAASCCLMEELYSASGGRNGPESLAGINRNQWQD